MKTIIPKYKQIMEQNKKAFESVRRRHPNWSDETIEMYLEKVSFANGN